RLEESKRSDWVLPSCSQAGETSNRIGFSFVFAVPATMESSPFQVDEPDADVRSYFIFPHGGSDTASDDLIIASIPGENTDHSSALPSKRSNQRWVKDNTGTIIGVDSREQRGSGYWRSVLFWDDDAASYDVKSDSKARSFDRIIDSACIARR